MSPDTGTAVVAAEVDAAEAVLALAAVVGGAPVDAADDPLSSPQAAATNAKSDRKTSRRFRVRRMAADRIRLIVSS
jgi:hypothetical protein